MVAVRAFAKAVRQAFRDRRMANHARSISRAFARADRHEVIDAQLTRLAGLLDERQYASARSWSDQLHDEAVTRDLGTLLRGVIAERAQHHALAVQEFDQVATDAWRHTPRPYLNAIFRTDPARGLTETQALLAASEPLDGETWFDLMANAYTHGTPELARQLFERAEAVKAGKRQLRRLDWVRPWIGAEPGRSAPPVPDGRVSFALIDYRQPGPDGGASSRNIGDWTQTLASIGHLVRHQGVALHGTDELSGLLRRLQGRVRPELRLAEVRAEVEVCLMQRDASSYQQFPPNTWMLMFGWFMHPLFGLDRYDFPPHPNLLPIVVSFHCAKKDFLTDEAIAYLRRYAPIGCRDWTTVDILLSLDIPAFFSGCVTTTVNTLFPDPADEPSPATLYVDATRSPVPDGAENLRQSVPDVLTNTFEQNIETTLTRLEEWRARYTAVETSRLHVYLPCRSLGMEVRYEPDSFSDPRVNGLLPLSDEGFDDIRTGIRELLEPVMTAILSGAPAEQVYRLWRELTAPAVSRARQRHEAAPPAPVATDARAIVHGSATAQAASLHLVYVPRENEWRRLQATLRGVLAVLPPDTTIWVVSSHHRQLDLDDPRVCLVEATVRMDSSLTGAARQARLLALLPELLPVPRAVLLPVGSVVTGDLTELGSLAMDGALVAARQSSGSPSSGSQLLFRVARRFDRDTERAHELLRELFRRHAFDFPAVDAELLVLDLAGMRAAGTPARLLDSMERYGLSWQAALAFEFGAAINHLDPAWAYVPTRDPNPNPKAWVWLDPPMPWSATGHASSATIWNQATAS